MGVDISKLEYNAIALAIDGEPSQIKAWRNPIPQDSNAAQLHSWEKWLVFWMAIYKPDIVAVEQLAVFMNKKTIRSLSHREGVALLVARKYGAIVLNPPVGSSRNVALGIAANSSKEVAWVAIRKMYPHVKFARSNQGGQDEADALTHALAAPTILERRK
jgi:Holliday junction resolvasome RuvABC endonuclease subunit